MKSFKQRFTAAALGLVVAPVFSFAPPAFAQGPDKITRTVLASGARGTTTTSATDVGGYAGFIGFLNVTANSGTNPTLDVKFQDSPDGNTWFDLVSFTQVTGSTASQTAVAPRAPARYVRAVGTVGGSSTPTFTYSLFYIAYRAPAVTMATALGGTLSGTSFTATGANGETSAIRYASESIMLSTAGATTNSSANLLPANSVVLGVSWMVTTAITGADSTALQVGDANVATRFGSSATLTAGTSGVGLNHLKGGVSTDNAGPVQVSAATLRITLAGGGDNTPSGGVVRVTVAYLQFTPPTT